MNILITGIHGYVGNCLVKSLRDKHELYGLEVDDSYWREKGVNLIFDLNTVGIMPPIDVIIHTAGKHTEADDSSDALEYFQANAGMSRRIFNKFVNSRTIKTFIYISSVKAAAGRYHKGPLTEDVEPRPSGSLGESKLLAERYILDRNVPRKKVYVLRTAMLHGFEFFGNRYLRKMYDLTRRGMAFPFGRVQSRSSLLAADNLVYVIESLLDGKIKSGIYNVADDESYTLTEVYKIMADCLEKPLKIRYWFKVFNYLFVMFMKIFNFSVFRYFNYREFVSDFIVCNDKIKKALKIARMPVSSEVGLRMTINSVTNSRYTQINLGLKPMKDADF